MQKNTTKQKDMKAGLFFILFLTAAVANSQTLPDTIYFYGYDYSHFKLIEPGRKGEDIKNYVHSWIGYCQPRFTERNLEVFMEKKKVYTNYTNMSELLNSVNGVDLVGFENSVNKDSIANYVKNYKINENKGIAFVVIPETFNKQSRTSTAYFVLFDIETRDIVRIDKNSGKDTGGRGLTNYWGESIAATTKKYIVKLYKEEKTYKKLAKKYK